MCFFPVLVRSFIVGLSILWFMPVVYGQADSLPGLVPNKYGTDHYALAAAISFDQHGERAKAFAIYNWVTHNISYNTEALRKLPRPADDKAIQALKTGKAVCEGYSELFVLLCRDAGLKAVTIEGYAKDWLFNNGDRLYIPRHEWSAVKIDGKWELVDATWGAGSVFQHRSRVRRVWDRVAHKGRVSPRNLKFRFLYDAQYFAQEPEQFRLRHLPSDPLWQLTDSAMALSVFEAGAANIAQFNECCSHPLQTGRRLDSIAGLANSQKLAEFADRAYTFNSRYPVVLAIRNVYKAQEILRSVASDSTPGNIDVVLKKTTADLKQSLEYIKEQRKKFPEEYNGLKKSNKSKTTDARQYVRAVITDDKRLIGLCRRYAGIAENRKAKAAATAQQLKTKANEIEKKRNSGRPDRKVGRMEKVPEVTGITDSIAVMPQRLGAAKAIAWELMLAAKVSTTASTALLDSLMASVTQEDSLLRNEALERMGMHDSYDDEVRKWNTFFKEQKYHGTDSMLKTYFALFDTISAQYERANAAGMQALSLFEKKWVLMEQYKNLSLGHAVLADDYAAAPEEYRRMSDSMIHNFSTYIAYIDGNIRLFNMLEKICERQIRIVGYMAKAEESRESMEAGSIARKKAFDLKENDRQRAAVQKALKELKKAQQHGK